MVDSIAKLTYRAAGDADAPLLAALNRQLIDDEGHQNPMTVDELAARMRGWLAAGYRAVVFELAGELVGYALFRERDDDVYLRQFFVARPKRRLGMGRRAIDILRGEVWPAGRRLTVDVLVSNQAGVAFWRAVGYRDYALTLEIVPPPQS
ncbi:MAG: N-acetyltransferase family protein [Pirellulales bacterium]